MMVYIIFSAISLLCLAHSAIAECADGWTKYGTSCYALYQGKTDWIDAGAYCREFGGNLATLNTTDRANNVKAFLNYVNHKNSAWAGGSDLRSEGLWVWDIDQASFSDTDWAPGQPDSKTSENCLLLHQPSGFRWHDAACTGKYDYVCERSLTPHSAIIYLYDDSLEVIESGRESPLIEIMSIDLRNFDTGMYIRPYCPHFHTTTPTTTPTRSPPPPPPPGRRVPFKHPSQETE